MSPFSRTRTTVPASWAAAAVTLTLGLLGVSVLSGGAAGAAGAASDGPVGLGTAASFAVLAGAGITNTGRTTITGDVGTFPPTTRSGFGSVTLTGTDHGGDAVTQGAKDALVTAYDDAAGRTPATPVAVELGGSTLFAGVYTSETFGLTGTLTLDAQGRTDAVFVFQAATTLITEVDSRVVLLNGASPCNVVWQVGSSATFKTRTRFTGDVLAYTSVTAQTSATFLGRLLARNGAVTLDTNTIDNSACVVAGSTPTPTASAPVTVTSPTATTSPAATVPTASPGNVVVPQGGPGVTPGGPGTGLAVPSATPGTPRRTSDGGLMPPLLPNTGLRGGLAVAALALLVLGGIALTAGHATTTRPRPRHVR